MLENLNYKKEFRSLLSSFSVLSKPICVSLLPSFSFSALILKIFCVTVATLTFILSSVVVATTEETKNQAVSTNHYTKPEKNRIPLKKHQLGVWSYEILKLQQKILRGVRLKSWVG